MAQDPDVTRYSSASGVTDAATLRATEQLVISMKAAGTWYATLAIYPFLGSTSASQAVNLRHPGLYDIAWASSPTFSAANGVTFDGVDDYGNTGIDPSTSGVSISNAGPSGTRHHFFILSYIRNTPNFHAAESGDGVINGSDWWGIVPRGLGFSGYRGYYSTATGDIGSGGEYAGFRMAVRTSSSGTSYVRRTTTRTSALTAAGGTVTSSGTYFIGARNNGSGTPVANSFTTNNLGLYMIGHTYDPTHPGSQDLDTTYGAAEHWLRAMGRNI